MQIIKIRAKFSREIEDDIRAEMEGIPEEDKVRTTAMALIAARITERIANAKAINPVDVAKFNELAYKIFPQQQDGGEFTKVERPEGRKIKVVPIPPLKLEDIEPPEVPSVKAHKAVPYDLKAETKTPIGFDFGDAIRLLKKGKKLSRYGWNGKGQYIALGQDFQFRTHDLKFFLAVHKEIENKAIVFFGTSGIQVGWLASQADMLAEDWYVVEEEK